MTTATRRLFILIPLLLAAGCSKSTPPSSAGSSAGADKPPLQPTSRAQQPGERATPPAVSAEQPKGDPTAPGTPVKDFSPEAQQVLERMAAAYRDAASYQDAGVVRLQFESATQPPREDQAPCSLAFERPNKLRLQVYLAVLVCDGQEMRGVIPHAPEEVLALSAPPKLTMEEIYSDASLAYFLTQGVAGESMPARLLFAEKPLDAWLKQASSMRLIEPAVADERPCDRVEARFPQGNMVFWVDQQSSVLRRIDFPTDELLTKLPPGDQVQRVTLWADYRGARLGGDVDDAAFDVPIPNGAKLVKRLDPARFQPAPEPPPGLSPLLGKKVPDFKLVDLNGQPVTLASLSGKVAVLDFWYTTCDPCQKSLPRLQQVYEKYDANDRVTFVAVSVDTPDVPDAALRSMFDALKVQVPIARDSSFELTKMLGVEVCPTLVLIGTDGTLQEFEPGASAELATLLPAKIERLLAGESLSDEARQRYQEQLAKFEKESQPGQLPKAEIAPEAAPQRLELTRVWHTAEIEKPGNVLVVQETDGARLVVHDGWWDVAELSLDGKLVARHALPIPKADVVAYLRTAVGRDGRRVYVGVASGQKQVFLFDADWKLLASYPPDREHDGIADALLADLDGDGQPELNVSYWGVVGVQGVSLAGERLWSNRRLEQVFRLTATEPNAAGQRFLVAAHGAGSLVAIDAQGNTGPAIVVPDRFISYVSSADLNGDGRMEYVGLSPSVDGQMSAVGFTLKGEELWTRDLPPGVPEHPIELIASGKLLGGEGQWLLPGADGSVHIVSAQGELVDRFSHGVALHGIAVTPSPAGPLLILSKPTGVEAWRVSEKR